MRTLPLALALLTSQLATAAPAGKTWDTSVCRTHAVYVKHRYSFVLDNNEKVVSISWPQQGAVYNLNYRDQAYTGENQFLMHFLRLRVGTEAPREGDSVTEVGRNVAYQVGSNTNEVTTQRNEYVSKTTKLGNDTYENLFSQDGSATRSKITRVQLPNNQYKQISEIAPYVADNGYTVTITATCTYSNPDEATFLKFLDPRLKKAAAKMDDAAVKVNAADAALTSCRADPGLQECKAEALALEQAAKARDGVWEKLVNFNEFRF